MVIKHNLMAMNSQRQLSIVSGTAAKRAEKLSSGYKVNRAADDAAGLSISEKMRKQIRGLTQATENAEDGISMVQIADGALNEVHDMLQRMNELCVKAANGTNSISDRQNIQDEVTQLITEIDRVAETTKFNETSLLDGSMAQPGRNAYTTAINNRKLDAIKKKYDEDKERFFLTTLNGANAGKVISSEELGDIEGTKIIYIKDDVVTQQSGSGQPTDANPQYDELKKILQNEIVPNAVQEIISAYSPAYDFLKGSNIGMGLRLATPATDTDLKANTLAYVRMGAGGNTISYQLCVNVASLNITNGKLAEESRNKLEVTIVHEMMHAFMDEALTNGMAGGSDRFPKWFIEGMAQSTAGGYYDKNDWVNGGLGIGENASLSDISTTLAANPIGGTADASDYGSGYLACMYLGYLQGGSNLSAAGIKSGLGKVLARIRGGESLQDVVTDLTGRTSTKDFEQNFATDNDVLVFVQNLTKFVGNGTGGVIGNLTKTDDILKNEENSQITLFKLNVNNDNVTNHYPAGYDVFSGGSATKKGTPGSMSPTGGTVPWDKPLNIVANKHATGSGSALHIGSEADMTNKLIVYIDAMDAESLGVDKVDVRTEDLASISIERVALAIAQVSAQRSELGAYQNRLEHTICNLDNVVENTTAAESRIRDTDMAKEMVYYSNANILQQVGQSMLAQSNQTNQGVLSLIA